MRRFVRCVMALALPATLAAQSPATPAVPTAPQAPQAPDGVMLAFARFADIFGSRLVAAFEAIPAARYDYRPTPPQQTVGYIAQHLEDANYSLCERFGDTKRSSTTRDALPDTIKARWPKDTLVTRLRASLRFCDTALDHVGHLESAALATTLLAFETDLAEHYSQIATYMRLLGLVPPSALPPRSRTAVAVPVATLSRYVGVYELAPGLDLAVTMRDGALFATSSNGGVATRLWAERDSEFFLKEVDAQITFTREATGAVSGLVLHQFGRDRPGRKIP